MPPRNSRNWVERMIVRRIPQSLDQFLLRDLGAVIALVGYPVGPIIVGPLYFGMGYASWVIANLLVGSQVKRPKIRYALFAVPLIAEFVMTQWDTVMDPSGSTLGKTWLWTTAAATSAFRYPTSSGGFWSPGSISRSSPSLLTNAAPECPILRVCALLFFASMLNEVPSTAKKIRLSYPVGSMGHRTVYLKISFFDRGYLVATSR
jgi:hypothetical protein